MRECLNLNQMNHNLFYYVGKYLKKSLVVKPVNKYLHLFALISSIFKSNFFDNSL